MAQSLTLMGLRGSTSGRVGNYAPGTCKRESLGPDGGSTPGRVQSRPERCVIGEYSLAALRAYKLFMLESPLVNKPERSKTPQGDRV